MPQKQFETESYGETELLILASFCQNGIFHSFPTTYKLKKNYIGNILIRKNTHVNATIEMCKEELDMLMLSQIIFLSCDLQLKI